MAVRQPGPAHWRVQERIYHHGLYVRRHNAGRHAVWGTGWTMNLVDLRKASLLVAGQDVLTSENVGLKLSLLVTYQVGGGSRLRPPSHKTNRGPWNLDGRCSGGL